MAKLAVIALLFVAGILLRRIGWLEARHGVRMLRIVANVGLPALIIGAIGGVPREPGLLALPASAVAVMLIVGVLAAMTARLLGLARPSAGALVVSAMAMNLAFVFPFVFVAWGPEALARTVVFDAGNAVTQWTLVYFLAARYGERHPAEQASAAEIHGHGRQGELGHSGGCGRRLDRRGESPLRADPSATSAPAPSPAAKVNRATI